MKFALLVLLFISNGILACEITIGCSYKCDFLYRLRLHMAARKLGYKANIVHLKNAQEMNQVDGVLIPGGADIDPKYYLSSVTPELASYTNSQLHLVKFSEEGRKRDPLEYELLKNYSQDEKYKRLPLLGICRGMQMMTVAQGIPLYLDLKTELNIKNRIHKFDRIMVNEPASLMKSLYGSRPFRGFEIHHQGLRVPYYKEHAAEYPLTKVTAHSNQGLVAEAIEYTHRPALGIQYHPEKSFSHTTFPVFKWFLTKACEYKNSMKDPL